jgi:hypothetical protein
MNKKDSPKQVKFQIDQQAEGGHYANIATVLHSENEFLVDFGMFLPGKETIKINSRIVMTPRTAKQLMMALSQNIQNYESKFGTIQLPKGPAPFPQGGPEIAQ